MMVCVNAESNDTAKIWPSQAIAQVDRVLLTEKLAAFIHQKLCKGVSET